MCTLYLRKVCETPALDFIRVTPVFAIILGASLNGEVITSALILGAIGVLLGLSLYQFGDRCLLSVKLSRKQGYIQPR